VTQAITMFFHINYSVSPHRSKMHANGIRSAENSVF